MPAKDTVERLALLLPAGTLARLEEVAAWYGLDRQDYARVAVVRAMVDGESSFNNARAVASKMTQTLRQGICRVCGQEDMALDKSLKGREAEGHNCSDCGEYFIEESLVAKLETNNVRLKGPERAEDWDFTPAGALPIAAVGPVRRWLREMRFAGEHIPLITEDGLTIATGALFEIAGNTTPQLKPNVIVDKSGKVTLGWKRANFFERLAYTGARWLELLDKLTGSGLG